MKITKLIAIAAVGAATLFMQDGAWAKGPFKTYGKVLEIHNCSPQTLKVNVSQGKRDVELDLPAGGRVSFDTHRGARPLIQIKTKALKKWKAIYSVHLPALEGGQRVYAYKWNGEILEIGQGC